MHLDDLRLFLDLCDTLHFGRAAAIGHRTPSAVSRTVARLERAVGARLLDRTRRGVRVTPAGDAFRRFAADTLGRYAALRAGAGGLTGGLTVYGTATAAAAILAPVLDRFRGLHPGVALTVRTGDVEGAADAVRAGVVDVAVAVRPGRVPAGLVFHPVAASPVRVYAPAGPGPVRDLLARRPVPWSEVPVVAPPAGPFRARLDGWFRARGVRPRVAATVAGSEAVVALVGLGFGVGVAARLVVEGTAAGRLVEPVRGGELAPVEICLCVRRDRGNDPVLRAFLAAAGSGG